MTTFDDEILMAFADGELDDERAIEVAAALEADQLLRDRLQRLRETGELLRAAVAPTLDIPDRLARLLQLQGKVIPLRAKPRAANWWLPGGAAIAAALAVWMAGTSVLTQQAGWLRNVDDGVAIVGPVEIAAMTTPSGELVRAGDLNIRPVVSFIANDGRACRDIHVRDKDMAARIIACRTPENAWRVEALANIAPRGLADTYQMAAAPKDPVIEAAFARIGVKATMGAEAENAAIARKWSGE